jgi:hypothetical protein
MELQITKMFFMVRGEEGRDKGKTAMLNNGRVGFTLLPSPFSLLP